MAFYKQVWNKAGFEKYERIALQYKGQLVATKRGTSSVSVDTAKAMQAFNSSMLVLNAALKDTAAMNASAFNKAVVDVKDTVENVAHK